DSWLLPASKRCFAGGGVAAAGIAMTRRTRPWLLASSEGRLDSPAESASDQRGSLSEQFSQPLDLGPQVDGLVRRVDQRVARVAVAVAEIMVLGVEAVVTHRCRPPQNCQIGVRCEGSACKWGGGQGRRGGCPRRCSRTCRPP